MGQVKSLLRGISLPRTAGISLD